MTSIRLRPIYEDNKTYPTIMPNGTIMEKSGSYLNRTEKADLTLWQKYDIIVASLKEIGSHEYCDCGCPNKRKARILGSPAQVWKTAHDALIKIGEID